MKVETRTKEEKEIIVFFYKNNYFLSSRLENRFNDLYKKQEFIQSSWNKTIFELEEKKKKIHQNIRWIEDYKLYKPSVEETLIKEKCPNIRWENEAITLLKIKPKVKRKTFGKVIWRPDRFNKIDEETYLIDKNIPDDKLNKMEYFEIKKTIKTIKDKKGNNITIVSWIDVSDEYDTFERYKSLKRDNWDVLNYFSSYEELEKKAEKMVKENEKKYWDELKRLKEEEEKLEKELEKLHKEREERKDLYKKDLKKDLLNIFLNRTLLKEEVEKEFGKAEKIDLEKEVEIFNKIRKTINDVNLYEAITEHLSVDKIKFYFWERNKMDDIIRWVNDAYLSDEEKENLISDIKEYVDYILQKKDIIERFDIWTKIVNLSFVNFESDMFFIRTYRGGGRRSYWKNLENTYFRYINLDFFETAWLEIKDLSEETINKIDDIIPSSWGVCSKAPWEKFSHCIGSKKNEKETSIWLIVENYLLDRIFHMVEDKFETIWVNWNNSLVKIK